MSALRRAAGDSEDQEPDSAEPSLHLQLRQQSVVELADWAAGDPVSPLPRHIAAGGRYGSSCTIRWSSAPAHPEGGQFQRLAGQCGKPVAEAHAFEGGALRDPVRGLLLVHALRQLADHALEVVDDLWRPARADLVFGLDDASATIAVPGSMSISRTRPHAISASKPRPVRYARRACFTSSSVILPPARAAGVVRGAAGSAIACGACGSVGGLGVRPDEPTQRALSLQASRRLVWQVAPVHRQDQNRGRVLPVPRRSDHRDPTPDHHRETSLPMGRHAHHPTPPMTNCRSV